MIAMPTLSTKGWLMTPELQLDAILSYYSATNPSQTLLYNGHVVSLQSAIFKCGGNMDNLTSIVQTDLTRILDRYFPETAQVSVDHDDDGTKSVVSLTVAASVVKDGQTFDMARSIEGIDSTFMRTQVNYEVKNLS